MLRLKSAVAYSSLAWTLMFSAGLAAGAEIQSTQLNLRLGQVGANYTVVASGSRASYSVPTSVDAELETFVAPKRSYFLRTTFSYDLSQAVMGYMYVGLGARYWFGSGGLNYDAQGPEFQVQQTKAWRYFAGADLGVSNAVVEALTAALVNQAALVNFGIHGGVTRQMSQRWGLTLLVGMSMGTSFTNISITSGTTQVLFGVSHAL